MSKVCVYNFNNVLTDIIKELSKKHEIVENPYIADVVVLWCEVEKLGWKDIITNLKDRKIRTVLVQHGRRGVSRIYPPFNDELISDVVCVWGENDKKRLLASGVPENRIKITGTPILKNLKRKVKHKGYNIVFSPDHWGTEIDENQMVAKELRKLKDVNIITKVLSGENSNDYDNIVESDRSAIDHLSICAEVLSKADLVVSISDSTFELMAEIMNIPVVVVDYWEPKSLMGDDKYKGYKKEYSKACIKTNIENLNKTIIDQLKNPKTLSKERKEIGILDGGVNIKNPTKEIIKVILSKR